MFAEDSLRKNVEVGFANEKQKVGKRCQVEVFDTHSLYSVLAVP